MSPHPIARTALLLALSACAAPTQLPPPDGRLDGTYIGHRTIDQSCGAQDQPIVFHVSGSEISVYSHSKRHRLEGTVSATGQIALSDIGRHRDIEGQIDGGRLIASETDTPSAKKRYKAMDVLDPLGSPCIWHYDATRAPPGAPGESTPETP